MNAKHILFIGIIGIVFACKRENPLSTPIPMAAFKTSDTLVSITDTVKFTNQSSNANLSDTTVSITWYFIGGTPSKTKIISPSVIYYAPGKYSVKLVISNKNGKDSILKTNYITVLSTLNNGLIAYYPFNGNANDASSNGYNGNVLGATLTADRFGNVNSAYSFNGINNYILLPDTFDFKSKSISVWFYTSSITSNLVNIYSYDHPNLLYGFSYLSLQAINGIDDIQYACANILGIDTVDISTNAWHNAVTVLNDSISKYYLDSKLVGQKSIKSYVTSNQGYNNFILGSSRMLNNRYFAGIIDEVRIYNRALTEKEILEIKNLNQ